MIQCKTDKLGPPVMALNGKIFEIYLLRNQLEFSLYLSAIIIIGTVVHVRLYTCMQTAF